MTDEPTTPEQIKQDGQNRVARTGVQSGAAGAVVVVGLWIAHQAGWNGDMPAEVVAASTFLLTTAGAWFTNRDRLRGNG